MKLYRPLHVCAYLFGVFPAIHVGDSSQPSSLHRFQIHGPGLAIKVFHSLLYWVVSFIVSVVTYQNLQKYQKLTKSLITTRVLNIEELFIYMIFTGIIATTVSQVHLLWPPVMRAVNDCFHNLCPPGDVNDVWQFFSAFSIILFVIYEFAMYYIIITYKFTFNSAKLICLFPPLSNITCMVIEQFFYLMCISLYLRLRLLHNDIKTLLHMAEHPRWRFRTNRSPVGASDQAWLGIPAFDVSDVRDLRIVHRACMELFARINRLFQLPLSLCIFDCMFRIIVYVYGIAFDITIVIWAKKEHINYPDVVMWLGYCIIRIIRLWYLHLCEYYVTKNILPMRLSLSWLSLILNPVQSRKLMLEIILFQHQLDTIKSKFEIFGILNINMTLFYAGFGTTLAYVMLLLQIFAFNQISMATISKSLSNVTNFQQ